MTGEREDHGTGLFFAGYVELSGRCLSMRKTSGKADSRTKVQDGSNMLQATNFAEIGLNSS